jgi:nucleoside-diphosphate-sugar epimerase
MTRVLLTGEGGMLATQIALAMESRGAQYEEVRVGAHVPRKSLAKVHRRAEVDICDRGYPAAVWELKPDIIVHCAALVNTDKCDEEPERCLEANLLGTVRVLEAARRSGAKLVYISTTASYDYRPHVPRPFGEGSPQRPPTLYGITKLAGEMLVTGQQQVPWLVIRPCFIFGDPPWDFSSAMTRVAVHSALKAWWPEKAGDTPRVTLDPENHKDYMRVEDFAMGAVAAIEAGVWSDHEAIYNITGERARRTQLFYDALQDALGCPLDVEWVPEADYMGHHVVSASRLRMRTAWEPVHSVIGGAKLLARATADYVARCRAGEEELLYK